MPYFINPQNPQDGPHGPDDAVKAPATEPASRILRALRQEYLLFDQTRVRSWQAWLAIGLFAGLAAAIVLAANRSLESELTSAASLEYFSEEQLLDENAELLTEAELKALEKKSGGFLGEVFGTSTPWSRYSIADAASLAAAGSGGATGSQIAKGADGVRLSDADGDGDLDVATAWEGSGDIQVYLNPGIQSVTQKWPTVTVGVVKGPEDAVLVDLDGDGAVDVVSSAEGGKAISVHWAPKESITDKKKYIVASLWKTEAIPDSRSSHWAAKKDTPGFQNSTWMFTVPMDVDGENGVDLVSGGKGGTWVGWFEAPENPRDLAAWRWHPVYKSPWLMSMAAKDMDGDGDSDAVLSPRKIGSLWLENPGRVALQSAPDQPWAVHLIGTYHKGLSMFQTIADVDRDGVIDVVLANRAYTIVYHRGIDGNDADALPDSWESYLIRVPGGKFSGTPKGVAVGDIDLDGKQDIIFTAEHAGAKSGAMWMSYRGSSPTDGFVWDPGKEAFVGGVWDAHEIGGKGSSADKRGAKFDLVEVLDADADGDLDVLACEEAHGLGVFWYRNPTR